MLLSLNDGEKIQEYCATKTQGEAPYNVGRSAYMKSLEAF